MVAVIRLEFLKMKIASIVVIQQIGGPALDVSACCGGGFGERSPSPQQPGYRAVESGLWWVKKHRGLRQIVVLVD